MHCGVGLCCGSPAVARYMICRWQSCDKQSPATTCRKCSVVLHPGTTAPVPTVNVVEQVYNYVNRLYTIATFMWLMDGPSFIFVHSPPSFR